MAARVAGVTVAGFEEPQSIHAFVVQFMTDVPAGDKLLNAVGGNVEYPGRFRIVAGFRARHRYYVPPFDPPCDPVNFPPAKRRRFDVKGNTTPRRTAASVAASAEKVKDARRAGQSKAAVRALAQKEGINGHSLFFSPSPRDKRRYPALRYLWEFGPELVPCDTMHLFLCKVFPCPWELFSGEREQLGDDLPFLLPMATRETLGKEIKAGRSTVPASQARSLRDISKHSGSYKAIVWMYFLFSVGEVVLAGQIPEQYFNMFMLLCRAGRLLFKPSALTNEKLQEADKLIKSFCHENNAHVFAEIVERVRLCRPTIVTLLDVTANHWSCGPAWSYWQLPAQRLIGTLSRLVRSRRFPYASLAAAVSLKYSADLVASFAESNVAESWVEATGRPFRGSAQDKPGTVSISPQPKTDLLPPMRVSADLIGPELASMQAVLALEQEPTIPGRIVAKQYFRLRLANGQITGTVSTSDDTGDYRRNHLFRVSSHVRQAARRGQGARLVDVNVYGAVHHYAVALIDG